MSARIGVINAHMFGTVTDGFEHVDWSTPDVWDEPTFESVVCATVEDYAAASPHMIVFEIEGAGGQDPGTTSSSPGRDYLVGMPVLVTVRDDGTVHLEICAEDIVEAVADCDTTEGVSDDQRVADSATAGAAFTARTLTLSTN